MELLANWELSLTGGGKYRQGDKDFMPLTTKAGGIGNQQLQSLFEDALQRGGLSARQLPTIDSTSCDNFTVRLDAGNNLPALVTRAGRRHRSDT